MALRIFPVTLRAGLGDRGDPRNRRAPIGSRRRRNHQFHESAR